MDNVLNYIKSTNELNKGILLSLLNGIEADGKSNTEGLEEIARLKEAEEKRKNEDLIKKNTQKELLSTIGKARIDLDAAVKEEDWTKVKLAKTEFYKAYGALIITLK